VKRAIACLAVAAIAAAPAAAIVCDALCAAAAVDAAAAGPTHECHSAPSESRAPQLSAEKACGDHSSDRLAIAAGSEPTRSVSDAALAPVPAGARPPALVRTSTHAAETRTPEFRASSAAIPLRI
jgi:hypothetical protein